MPGIKISKQEWEEIYAALMTKKTCIQAGQYDPEDEPGDNESWIADLEGLMAKIGPDGTRAAQDGVKPCPR